MVIPKVHIQFSGPMSEHGCWTPSLRSNCYKVCPEFHPDGDSLIWSRSKKLVIVFLVDLEPTQYCGHQTHERALNPTTYIYILLYKERFKHINLNVKWHVRKLIINGIIYLTFVKLNINLTDPFIMSLFREFVKLTIKFQQMSQTNIPSLRGRLLHKIS